VVLFYRHGLAGPHDEVLIASRMFLRGDDVADLATVIGTLCERVHEYRQAGTFDPLVHLTDRAEPLTGSGQYLGVGTSSLQPGHDDAAELPWCGLAELADGTRLRLRRPPGYAVRTDVVSTHTLDTGDAVGLSPYMWQWASRQRVDTDTASSADALGQLHGLLLSAHADGRRHRGSRSQG
jgi:hypothetical protein